MCQTLYITDVAINFFLEEAQKLAGGKMEKQSLQPASIRFITIIKP